EKMRKHRMAADMPSSMTEDSRGYPAGQPRLAADNRGELLEAELERERREHEKTREKLETERDKRIEAEKSTSFLEGEKAGLERITVEQRRLIATLQGTIETLRLPPPRVIRMPDMNDVRGEDDET